MSELGLTGFEDEQDKCLNQDLQDYRINRMKFLKATKSRKSLNPVSPNSDNYSYCKSQFKQLILPIS